MIPTPTQTRRRPALTFAATSLAAAALAAGLTYAATTTGAAPVTAQPDKDLKRAHQHYWFGDEGPRLVFFAVLEGLYRDGVSEASVNAVISKEGKMETSFIYTCSLCHPAFEAFRIYATRRPFINQKVTRYDNFGPGLDAATTAALTGADSNARRDMVQALIRRWVKQRLDLMRLTPAEISSWEERLAELAKRGKSALERFKRGDNGDHLKRIYQGWETCPTCDGTTGACKPPE